MNYQTFTDSLNQPHPPADLSPLLRALWHDAQGHWDRAHEIAQDLDSPEAAWVHAYLHRREGDQANAGYWYRRAGKPFPTQSLQEEWESIARRLADDG